MHLWSFNLIFQVYSFWSTLHKCGRNKMYLWSFNLIFQVHSFWSTLYKCGRNKLHLWSFNLIFQVHSFWSTLYNYTKIDGTNKNLNPSWSIITPPSRSVLRGIDLSRVFALLIGRHRLSLRRNYVVRSMASSPGFKALCLALKQVNEKFKCEHSTRNTTLKFCLCRRNIFPYMVKIMCTLLQALRLMYAPYGP